MTQEMAIDESDDDLPDLETREVEDAALKARAAELARELSRVDLRLSKWRAAVRPELSHVSIAEVFLMAFLLGALLSPFILLLR